MQVWAYLTKTGKILAILAVLVVASLVWALV
jgi:hypothetical protein